MARPSWDDSRKPASRGTHKGCGGKLYRVGFVRGEEHDRCDASQCGRCRTIVVIDWRSVPPTTTEYGPRRDPRDSPRRAEEHMTKYEGLFKTLSKQFDKGEVKERKAANRTLSYITARTAMNRLDEVLGPENWWDEYEQFGDKGGCICKLSVRLPDGSVVTKQGIGGTTEMHDPSDTDKTAESDALKRAAVKFGVGRYLYRDGSPDFSGGHDEPKEAPQKGRETPSHRESSPQPRRDEPRPQPQGNAPRTGRALFAWTKEMEQKHQVGLLKWLNGWGKLQEFPGRMIDWDAEQVAYAYEEASKKLQSVQTTRDEAYEEALSNG